jgi:hypothetical protein
MKQGPDTNPAPFCISIKKEGNHMTDKQLEANRANAQLSTGPRTEEGKRRSSFNGFKSGIYSKIHIATPEETESFQLHCAAYRDELAPAGAIETDLVQLIAEDRWRLKRAHCIENALFAQGINHHSTEHDTGRAEVDDALAEGQTCIDNAKFLTTLTQYEQRVQRSIKDNTAALNAHQMGRKEAYLQAQKEAIMLKALADDRNEIYDPTPDFPPSGEHGGFAFDAAECARKVSRDERIVASCYLKQPVPLMPKIRPQAA